MSTVPHRGTGGSATSWILFAGIVLATLAVLNIVWGIAAIGNSAYFVDGARYILFDDLNAYGWIAILIGALELVAAFSIWRGGSFGRWFGIAVAVLSVWGALLSMPASPLWSFTTAALGVLVIYALAAYGGGEDVTA